MLPNRIIRPTYRRYDGTINVYETISITVGECMSVCHDVRMHVRKFISWTCAIFHSTYATDIL